MDYPELQLSAIIHFLRKKKTSIHEISDLFGKISLTGISVASSLIENGFGGLFNLSAELIGKGADAIGIFNDSQLKSIGSWVQNFQILLIPEMQLMTIENFKLPTGH